MHQFLVSAAAFIVLIGVMVVVHEFGHFAVAKLCGVRIEAFSVGFGPRLFGCKYGDTDYKVCLLPLGGYVKMAGENFAEVTDAASGTATQAPEDDPGSFTAHPRWQRMLIGLAGPVSNFILAFVLMVLYFGFINEVPSVHPIIVEWVTAASPAAQAGLEPGDVVRDFGAADNPSWDQIQTIAAKSAGQTLPVTVERGGKTLSLQMRLSGQAGGQKPEQESDLEQDGLFLQLLHGPIQVNSVVEGSPAQQAGLRAGDFIFAADGHDFHTLDPLVAYLQTEGGRPVTLTVRRNGQMLPPVVVHPAFQDSSWRMGFAYLPPANIPTHWCEGFLRVQLHAHRRCPGPDSDPQDLGFAACRSGGNCADGRPGSGDERLVAQVRSGGGHQPQPGHPQPAAFSNPGWRHDFFAAD
jgi:regulator of sigma E protease